MTLNSRKIQLCHLLSGWLGRPAGMPPSILMLCRRGLENPHHAAVTRGGGPLAAEKKARSLFLQVL